MDEIELAMLRHKKRRNDSKKEDNKISREFSKILLSIIFVLSSIIFMKLNDNNKAWFKSHVLESNFAFMKINDWYHQTFGDILPSFDEKQSVMVGKETSSYEREKYLDGYKIHVLKSTPVKAIVSGILVYIGDKDGYKSTYIMQGVDGIDIWYGNLQNSNYKLYDYIEEGQIIGESIDDYYTLVFLENGKFITYEEYFKQV